MCGSSLYVWVLFNYCEFMIHSLLNEFLWNNIVTVVYILVVTIFLSDVHVDKNN